MTAHSTIITTINADALTELALRFKWIRPAGCGVKPQPLKTMPWGRQLGRRWTVVKGGVKVPTLRFLAAMEASTRWDERAASFGGCCDAYMAECLELDIHGSWLIYIPYPSDAYTMEWERRMGCAVSVSYEFRQWVGGWHTVVTPHHLPTTRDHGWEPSQDDIKAHMRRMGVTSWQCVNPLRAGAVLEHLNGILG